MTLKSVLIARTCRVLSVTRQVTPHPLGPSTIKTLGLNAQADLWSSLYGGGPRPRVFLEEVMEGEAEGRGQRRLAVEEGEMRGGRGRFPSRAVDGLDGPSPHKETIVRPSATSSPGRVLPAGPSSTPALSLHQRLTHRGQRLLSWGSPGWV